MLPARIEWPTMGVFAVCYMGWGMTVAFAHALGYALAIPILSICLTLHSSLQHEATHGHPTNKRWLNTLLAGLPLGLLIPFPRFQTIHLAHHRTPHLTCPIDDPESFYLTAAAVERTPAALRVVLAAHNTLLGRMLLGPALLAIRFLADEARRVRAGEPGVARAWAVHGVLITAILLLVTQAAGVPLWAYLLAVYGGQSILLIRTFAEHQAHNRAGARTVIIEDRGPLSWLFLNNNLHAVHHARPAEPWYRLPRLYRADVDRWHRHAGGYRFAGYGALIRHYWRCRKEPLAHPFFGPSS